MTGDCSCPMPRSRPRRCAGCSSASIPLTCARIRPCPVRLKLSWALAAVHHRPFLAGPHAHGRRRGRKWVVHNGEIYNYRELRAKLGGADSFHSSTDTEVLLRGWDAWGDGVTERLRGMFAFALFEAAPRPRLLLGRDRFGIKPLYCHEDRARVVFASEVRAVVMSGLVPDETSSEALGRFLELGVCRRRSPRSRTCARCRPATSPTWMRADCA